MRSSLLLTGRLACLLSVGAIALAQGTQTATISGEVVDQKGRAVAGAQVRVTSPALQVERTLKADANGHFRAPLLPPGDYRIVVTAPGLNTATLTQRLGLEKDFSPRIVMRETASATVEVVSDTAQLDKTEFKTAQNYTKEMIDNLPVGRASLLSIAYLSPGVVENASESRGGVTIRGSQGTGNLFMVDGQNVNDNLYQGQRIGIIFDTVEETQVLTGALPAEYGDVEGGVVNSVTKSGGNEFSGSVRWDLSNPGWNAVKPLSARTPYANNAASQRSFQLGGPIWKDKVWFHFGYFDNHPKEVKSLADSMDFYDPVGGNYRVKAGTSYQSPDDDYRRELKITAALGPNHSLAISYHNYRDVALQNYGAGELAALTNLYKTGEFWNVALRSLWSSNFTSSIRFGQKKQELGSIGGDTGKWVINDDGNGYLAYGNTIFNPNDPQPDQRNNKTANIKGTLFLDSAGHHQIDFGLDYYQGTTMASGDQGPIVITGPAGSAVAGKRLNQWWVDTDTINFADNTFAVYDGYFGEWVVDKCTATTTGLHLNDKWTLDEHWIFQIGLRMDKYTAEGQKTGSIGSATSFSPRLGAKWDVLGDSTWVAGLSYAKYNGRMLETVLQNKTYVNNSRYYAFGWVGPDRAGYSQISNLANYDWSAPIDYSDAALNIKFDGSLKPPTVAETQASLAYNFKQSFAGNGYLKLTVVNKTWGNLIDYRAGNDGKVSDPFDNSYYYKVWFNNPAATRSYKGMELEVNAVKGQWNLAGYINWSRLRGNYVGEGAASPGRGQGLAFFTIQNGTRMYDPNLINPDGYLPGHIPVRMRWTATYATANALGKQTWGFLYRFDSGLHYSSTRSIARNAINPGLDSMFGSSATQYLGERGDGVYNGAAYLDFSLQQDLQLFKVGQRPVQAFVKADISNVLNHQQIVNFDTTYANVGKTGSASQAWVRGSDFGKAVGSGNFGEARSVRLSAGVKF